MSWLDDAEYDFKYVCEEGHESIYKQRATECDPEVDAMCLTCEKAAKYAGFVPQEIGIVSKVAFDQNGRKGYAISDGHGGVSYISKTKYDYIETGKINNQYTPEYEAKLRQDEDKNEYLLKSETNRRMATVRKAYAGKGFKPASKGM